MPTESARATTPSRRAHLLAEAVVSAYIDEIAGPRQRVVRAPRRSSTARTPADGHTSLPRRRARTAIELAA